MTRPPNTLFLRLEGPLQSWGDTSKFVMRHTMEAPTKSGVLGLVCSAMGLSRKDAEARLAELNKLAMGVRVDRAGMRWWDWHTVGARIGMTTAAGTVKTGAQGTVIKRLEYLADASFLVALQGDSSLVEEVASALREPKRPLFLGRRSCPPSRPIWDGDGCFASLEEALKSKPWRPRLEIKHDDMPKSLDVFIEWAKSENEPTALDDAEVWYDVAKSFEPPYHGARFVVRSYLAVNKGDGSVTLCDTPEVSRAPRPNPPRADYKNKEFRAARAQRLADDHGLCVFCKSPASTVQHITYRRAGGDETQEDLRSLCRLCHDAVTMIEYGLGMGLDRINPEEVRWRDAIIRKRDEITRFRSVEGRRRALARTPEGRQALQEEEE